MMVPGDGGDAVSSSARRSRRRPEPTPLQRALALLTRREHSRKDLLRKLELRGISTEDARAATDKLAAEGWQSELRFAESMLRSRAGSGYGPAYIRAELGTHGLDSELVGTVLQAFDGDWIECARALVRRRHPQVVETDAADAKAARRQALDLLLRRGFSMDQARAALETDDDAGFDAST